MSAGGCAGRRVGPQLGAALLVLSLLGIGCTLPSRYPSAIDANPPYRPDRRDYAAFGAAHPELLEPNYLPFMAHRFRGDDARGDILVFCRWPDAVMPLPVYIEAPRISDELQDEFHPVRPEVYVERVASAMRKWERELEGLVRFRRVDRAADALLQLRLRGEVAPTPSERVQVLGATHSLSKVCRLLDWTADRERMELRFRVPELSIYVADRSGMLTPEQVERVALHEIGHALGMAGHSPVPTDFMYRMVQDRPGADGLSTADVNSFVSLYRLPNGAAFGYVSLDGPAERPSPNPPSRGPELSSVPHVDASRGFEIRLPESWVRIETERGFFAADGPIWDRDASLEVMVWPQASVEEFLGRFSRLLFEHTWLRRRDEFELKGRRALRVEVENADQTHLEEFTIVELGDGRVMLLLTRCPLAVGAAWRPWFRAMLESLEIWQSSPHPRYGR